ncbi:MAG TPA: lysine--tRNA ligase [Verrucomicrobiae bacterium]|nr:lysine--tRNA ligase [Verrucomicrobiae bacterium]
MEPQNDLIKPRLEKREKLIDKGIDPYGGRFDVSESIATARANPVPDREVRLAGRVMSHRDMGKSLFADLKDSTAKIQIYVKKQDIGDEQFDLVKNYIDLGDIIGVVGKLFTTHAGELTVKVENVTLLSKAIQPLPKEWYGIKDVETRLRQRYLDLVLNDNVRDTLLTRSRIVAEIRKFLNSRGFIEVETPMMQPIAGGAVAKPFKTHHEALDIDLFLRVAPELYLKRLLVGGFERIYEINRNFRNEGISRRHNPEFTMLEVYQAYGDYETMMDLAQGLIVSVAENIVDSLLIKRPDGQEIDLTPPWRRVTYHELVEERIGKEWFTLSPDEQRTRATNMGVEFPPGAPDYEVTNAIFEKTIEPTLMNPTFVTHLPAELVVLAKPNKQDPHVVDVFELVINGQEIAPAYSELNDPVLQRVRLLMQARGHDEKLDEDFLMALEHGMPPAGGMGMGIDRLVMMLTGAESIRDVILFPLLRPQT